MQPPVLHDIYAARAAHRRRRSARRRCCGTRCSREETGLDLWVKHENHNPTSAFKVRGGLNLVRSLSADERARGIVTASTGNHGQSIALACQLERRRAAPCSCPTATTPRRTRRCARSARRSTKAAATSTRRASAASRRRPTTGARYVHSANEPLLIAGVGTYALEIFEALPDVDVDPRADRRRQRRLRQLPRPHRRSARRPRVIGVQAANADAFARSWRGTARASLATAPTRLPKAWRRA